MKLYNLTYEKDYYISRKKIQTFPETNFCLVECEYNLSKSSTKSSTSKISSDNNKDKSAILNIYKISGFLKISKTVESNTESNPDTESTNNTDNEIRECILGPLDLTFLYSNFLKFMSDTNVNKEKIDLQIIDDDSATNYDIDNENSDRRLLDIFIVLTSSYLVYMNFSDLPYNVSINVLTSDYIKEYILTLTDNSLEQNFQHQVNVLYKYFNRIFNSISKNSINNLNYNETLKKEISDYLEEKFSEWNDTQDKIIDEIREYKRKLLLDLNNRQQSFPSKELLEKLSQQLSDLKSTFQSL